MCTASAFAPGHLTGLFQICDQYPNPLQKGSRGSGVSLDIGVHTHVKAEKAEKHNWTIKINGNYTSEAFVSENVLRQFKHHLPSPMTISVEHNVETPMVAGFGSSGGGALSLALALNAASNTGLTRLEASQIAHIAEIECRTGLGSVFAAERGGFGVLTEPGAPGIGKAISYPNSGRLRAVYVFFGSIYTKEALGNQALRVKINEMGGRFVDELKRDPTPELFMRLSRRFTEHIGLVTPRLRILFDRMDTAGYTFSMAMFGEVAFAVMDKNMAIEAAKALEEASQGYEAVILGIDNEGAKVF
jgi:pantoate kinase